MKILISLIAGITLALANEEPNDTDGEQSRKILGSSVVTSVSVIMDTGNGSKTVFADAVGKPVPKPSSASELASPINLLNPDRYEFYTFDDNGDLIKRLMSLEEIQGIIATGDSDGYDLDSFTSLGYLPEKKVNDVVNNVQSVLKEEMQTHKDSPVNLKPIFDTPDVSDSWSMILPAVFGNSGEDIKPEKPIVHVTPDTIMIEPNMQETYTSPSSIPLSSTIKPIKHTVASPTTPSTTKQEVSTNKPSSSPTPTVSTINTQTVSIPTLTPTKEAQIEPVVNVEIYSNSKSTETPLEQSGSNILEVVEIKPSDPQKTTIKPSTTKEPFTTPFEASESVKTENTTYIRTTYVSTSSPLPTPTLNTKQTIKTNTTYVPLTTVNTVTPPSTTTSMPLLTKATTEMPLSTWRPDPINTDITETANTRLEEIVLSTKEPEIGTYYIIVQKQTTKEVPPIPTLTEFLNSSQTEPAPTLPVDLQEVSTSTVNDNKDKNSILTESNTEASQTMLPDTYVEGDLNTLSSEHFGIKNDLAITQQYNQITTDLPLEQSLNTAQKISASEVLDQLLFTTNIYEINTELAEKMPGQQLALNEDNRFETTTVEAPKLTEQKTELPVTTEEFIIKVMDNTEAPSTDRTLMESIDQLLSQAVVNVEEAIFSINDTDKIQNMLNNSGKKNMTDLRKESATLASDMLDLNNERTEETTTLTTVSTTGMDEINLLSESVGSLLSQISDNNQANMTTIDYIIPTEKSATISVLNRETDYITDSTTTEKTTTASTYTNEVSTKVPDEEQESTTQFESTTIFYIPVATIINNNSENQVQVKNVTKPNKSDLSLEEELNDEIRKNSTVNQGNKTSMLSAENSTELKSNANIYKNPNEILLAEESISALYNRSDLNSGVSNGITSETENTTPTETTVLVEASTEQLRQSTLQEESTTATASTNSIEEISSETEEPATIIIIKRTKKPTTETPSTIDSSTQDESTINKETTVFNENLESTTYQHQSETTDMAETAEPTTIEVIKKYVRRENTTAVAEEVQPTIDVIISENNKVSETTKPDTENNQTNIQNTEMYAENPYETNNAQESSNVNIKIPSNTLQPTEHKEANLNRPSENENEKTTENKPNSTWTLVPTIAPHREESISQSQPPHFEPHLEHFPEIIEPPSHIDLTAKPLQGFGLEDSTSRLDTDIYQFAQLCNELAFGFWKTVTNGISSARSVIVSPFGSTSLLAMVFLGARGATSGEMNEILRLDDMVTFNPHLIFKNVTESVKTDVPSSGVAASVIIRELFSDRSKGKLLPFYKERAKAFYDGYVEEVSFREIGDVIRRRTNLQVKKYTNGKITEYLKDSSITARPPLAGVSVNIFQTDCSQASIDGRDGELHFVVLPSIRQRRLIPIPAVVYKSGFLAGYEPSLDATAVALGTKDQITSTILVIPGQQGIPAPGDGLARLEKRLVESSFKKGAWSRLLRSLIPRPGLEVQIPKFTHKSLINATVTLKKMGLHDLFDGEKADLRGLNGVANELYLSDMLQINSFATCGEKRIGAEAHHSEIYPATAVTARNARYLDNYQGDVAYRSELLEEPRDYQRAFHDPLHDPSYLSLPLSLRPRQARVPESPRLKFDRPFIYFVRHNPTGLILHMGRFNPRLLP